MWGVNDQGSPANVYAFQDKSGNSLLHTLTITGLTTATQVQFEDLSKCTLPGGGRGLMIGRIGNGYSMFIRVAEPTVAPGQAHATSSAAGTEFHFTPVAADHEGFFVDPISGDLYLLEKQQNAARPASARVWKIPASTLGSTGRPASNPIGLGTPVATVKVNVESTNNGAPTAADISDDGKYIMVANYQELMIWRRDPATQTVEQALRRGGSSTTPADPHVRVYVPSTASNTFGAEAYCFDRGNDPTVGFSMSESTAGTSSLKKFTLGYGTV